MALCLQVLLYGGIMSYHDFIEMIAYKELALLVTFEDNKAHLSSIFIIKNSFSKEIENKFECSYLPTLTNCQLLRKYNN